MDWGDASIGHPFASLYVTYRFLEKPEYGGLAPGDPWLDRLRDAYLEPWGGPARIPAFERALRVAAFGHAIAWLRHRDPMPAADKVDFDIEYAVVLRRAIARIPEPGS